MKLKQVNNSLSVIAVFLGLYLLFSPFIPQLLFLFRDTSPAAIAPYEGRLAQSNENNEPKPLPGDNRIVIPALSLNEPIKEGADISVIDNGGTWRRPQTSTPDQGGNTVIVAHRYFASRASTFYHLDKITSSDRFAVYWDKQEYLYEVVSTEIVDASVTQVEDQTDVPTITLYTCHPLWTAEDRLVVVAHLIEEES